MKKIFYVLSLGVLLAACGNKPEAGQDIFLVEVVAPTREAAAESFRTYPFISKPYNETQLSFRVSGPVLDFDLRAGRAFSKGSTILAIDERDFRVRRQQAEAVYLQANEEYKRIKALYEKNNISGSAYEKAKADFLVASSHLESARNALQDTRLIAPYDGYIQSVHIEPFQEVRAAQAIVTFIELDRLKIETYIPEEVALSLRGKDIARECPVSVRFDNQPDTTILPLELSVSKSTTLNNLSYLLTATLPNPDKEWLGGMSGTLSFRLPAGTREEKLSLPLHAICHRPGKGDHVWVARDGKARLMPVKLGKLAGNRMEILEGIGEGDRVICTRQAFLSEHKDVTIQESAR